MPELPEVEASRRFLERHCVDKIVTKAHAQHDEKVFCGHSTSEVQLALEGRRMLSAGRKGKYFWTQMDGSGDQVLFHFGMTGQLIVRSHGHPYAELKDTQTWPPRFTKLEFTMDDGTQVAFTDARRFAKVRLLRDPPSAAPVKSLGPDAYSDMPSVAEFTTSLRRYRRPIKALLIDQGILSGIGNWVADEILYQASIFPEVKGDMVTETQAELIHTAICDVLNTAVDAGANSENFPSSWLFHHRWTGKVPTKTGNGQAVQFLKVGGRTTAYVPAVQAKHRSPSTAASRKCLDNTTGTMQGSSRSGIAAPKMKRPRQQHDQDAQTSPVQNAAVAAEPRDAKSKATTTTYSTSVRDGDMCKSGRPVRACRAAHKA